MAPPLVRTVVRVVYPLGGKLSLRGGASERVSPRPHKATPSVIAAERARHTLSWTRSIEASLCVGDVHEFVLALPEGEAFEVKVLRDEHAWSMERPHLVVGGDDLTLAPWFDTAPRPPERHLLPTGPLSAPMEVRVLVPPSYGEQLGKRYPVLYAQDGQALFVDGGEGWRIEEVLRELVTLGALDELILVAIRTERQRVELLTPSRDEELGGGHASEYVEWLATELKPYIDERYRTQPEREHTGLLGASLGGLFSFFAAWTRPTVFGKAACLSSSFWWDRRRAMRHVVEHPTPEPRPVLYLDTGAPLEAFERDASRVDGYADTLAMGRLLTELGYQPGADLHTLAFPGDRHSAVDWGARVGIPLQLLFPHHAARGAPHEVDRGR